MSEILGTLRSPAQHSCQGLGLRQVGPDSSFNPTPLRGAAELRR